MSQPRLDLLAKVALGLASLVSLVILLGLIALAQMARGPEGGQVPELLGLAGLPPIETDSHAGQSVPPPVEKAPNEEPLSGAAETNQVEPSGDPESPEPATSRDPSTEEAVALVTAEEPLEESKRRRAPRKRTRTSKKRPKRIEPATEPPTPEEPPKKASFKLLPRAITDRATPGKKTLFEVGMEPANESKETRVHMKMQCKPDKSRWRRYTMKRTGRKLWSAEINFRIEDRGTCRYYFTAREGAAAPEVTLGSRSTPYKVRVR